jgi:hypothetical protein
MVGIRASVLLIGALCGVTLAFIFSQRQATFFFWLRLEAALWNRLCFVRYRLDPSIKRTRRNRADRLAKA